MTPWISRPRSEQLEKHATIDLCLEHALGKKDGVSITKCHLNSNSRVPLLCAGLAFEVLDVGGPVFSRWTRSVWLSICDIVVVVRARATFLRSYVTSESLKSRGGVYLRPWHLPFSPTAGLKGILEPVSRLKNVDSISLLLRLLKTKKIWSWILLRTSISNCANSSFCTGCLTIIALKVVQFSKTMLSCGN